MAEAILADARRCEQAATEQGRRPVAARFAAERRQVERFLAVLDARAAELSAAIVTRLKEMPR
jgi:hypothetical protein